MFLVICCNPTPCPSVRNNSQCKYSKNNFEFTCEDSAVKPAHARLADYDFKISWRKGQMYSSTTYASLTISNFIK